MEIISLNCNKLKIITQYISYNHIIYIIFESILWGGGLIRKEGLISFFYSKGGGGLFERGHMIRHRNSQTCCCCKIVFS